MSILCKLGFHKPSKTDYVRVRMDDIKPYEKTHAYFKYHNVCERCGKKLRSHVSFKKERDV